ncbi:hypothetical protein AB0950_30550 [Streptomyces sp. NPDC007189]|uniref:hypothetical protein n=1 Tax=Streptomyces sp. NPDC007189 TaxID=3154315 RepID=UPI003453EC6A
MRLTRCALAAATVTVSASAVALSFFYTHFTAPSSDVEQVRMVSAMGAARSKAESPEPSAMDPLPKVWEPPCYSYGGPYCGWVREYRGGCDWEWGLSYGIKDPRVLCPHDPRPSPSAAASSSAGPSPSESTAPSDDGDTTGGTSGDGDTSGGTSGDGDTTGGTSGSGGTTARLSRLAGPKHKRPAEPHRSAAPTPTAPPSATATAAPVGDLPQQQSFPTGPGRMPSAPSSTGGVDAPAVVEPQAPPGEEVPDTASLLQAVRTAAEGFVFFPYVVPFPEIGPSPFGTADAAAPLVP